MGRERHVLEDEHFFARTDQPELAPGDLLDRGGIVGEPTCFIPKACVLGALARDCGRQLVVLFPGAQHREESLFAHQRVDHDDRRDDQQQPTDDPAAPAGAFRCRGIALGPGTDLSLGHEGKTVQQLKSKYKSKHG